MAAIAAAAATFAAGAAAQHPQGDPAKGREKIQM
jgi:hypothetical protein